MKKFIFNNLYYVKQNYILYLLWSCCSHLTDRLPSVLHAVLSLCLCCVLPVFMLCITSVFHAAVILQGSSSWDESSRPWTTAGTPTASCVRSAPPRLLTRALSRTLEGTSQPCHTCISLRNAAQIYYFWGGFYFTFTFSCNVAGITLIF